MTDLDDLARTIVKLMAYSPSAGVLAEELLDAGYRRVVVDDAMIERAAAVLWDIGRETLGRPPWHEAVKESGYTSMQSYRDDARAALTAALGRTEP